MWFATSGKELPVTKRGATLIEHHIEESPTSVILWMLFNRGILPDELIPFLRPYRPHTLIGPTLQAKKWLTGGFRPKTRRPFNARLEADEERRDWRFTCYVSEEEIIRK